MVLVCLLVAKYEVLERVFIGFSARRSSLLYGLILQETLLSRQLHTQAETKRGCKTKKKFFSDDFDRPRSTSMLNLKPLLSLFLMRMKIQLISYSLFPF